MLYHGDCIQIMKTLPAKSVDMVFADPPYFLSNGGVSIHSGKIVSVDKGEWDKASNYDDVKKFTAEWIHECYRLLKDTGTIWVTGTHHNIFTAEQSLKDAGFRLINAVIWHKSDPPPLIYRTKFRFSYEMILWCGKGRKHYFDYNAMYCVAQEEMHDVWTIPAVRMPEKRYGYHPTQKPEELLKRIIIASTQKDDLILDPFLGSGTTAAVAKALNRRCIGIEKDDKFFDIARRRVGE